MATTSQPATARHLFFQQCKALCVPLSQLAIRATDKTASAKEIVNLIDQLTRLWDEQSVEDPSVLDEKLAEYVFFPLSHILRTQEQYPIRVSEAVIRLLTILVRHGWKAKLTKELSQQLLLFLAFLVGGIPGQEAKKRDLPEETIVEAYRALKALVTAAGTSISAPPQTSSHTTPDDVTSINPALGYSITVVLDGIVEGLSSEVQLNGLDYIDAVFTAIKEDRVLGTFLPGTVSALGKVLSAPQHGTQRRVLIRGLEVLKHVLVTVLDDFKTRRLLNEIQNSRSSPSENEAEKKGDVLTTSWLSATASQVKIALASVLKLRNHEFSDVQTALYRFCIALLSDCHSSLAECQLMLVESAMIAESDEIGLSTTETSLRELATIYPKLGSMVKATMYQWAAGLPRVMQASEERPKQMAIRKILNGTELITALGVNSSTLSETLGSALKDSIVALLLGSGPARVVDEVNVQNALITSSDLAGSDSGHAVYRPFLITGEGQKATRAEILQLIARFGSPTQLVQFSAEMLGIAQDSEGAEQVAAYWLSFELMKATMRQSATMDDFLEDSMFTETEGRTEAFEDLYQFSASIVSSHSDAADVNWKLEAIAMEVVAFASSRMRRDFRRELIDVLYPIATFLGSDNPQLRGHAITTLNQIAEFSEYSSVSELIIDNIDYMVNSVSLRLNTFDISPASTKVLSMMIRLTGPRVIPFLDDVVVAIFAALDNFHGYPAFAESLFAVLGEVVEQGVKSDQLLLGDTTREEGHQKSNLVATNIAQICQALEVRIARQKQAKEDEAKSMSAESQFEAEWKLLEKKKDERPDEDGNSDAASEKEGDGSQEVDPLKPSQTPTYAILSRITTLTQHYLTSPTPSLRKSLLHLLATVSPALAPDDNAFLPLVNDVWPVVISRLKDPEPFVVIAACEALRALCISAGDFLTSRFKTEWSEGLAAWFRRSHDAAAKATASSTSKAKERRFLDNQETIVVPIRSAQGELVSAATSSSRPLAEVSGGLGRFTQAAQVWEAASALLTAMVAHVRMDDGMFDQILDLLAEAAANDEVTRKTLESVNADAVWLALYRRGMVEWRPAPELAGVPFTEMDVVRDRSWYGTGQRAVPIGLSFGP